MEPFTCTTCEARVVPPPLQLDGLGHQLRQCACCEAILSWDAFARATARSEARRCTSCTNAPRARAFWHRPTPAPPQPEPDRRALSMALVAITMGPTLPPPVVPPREERDNDRRKRRRRRHRVQPRKRSKQKKQSE